MMLRHLVVLSGVGLLVGCASESPKTPRDAAARFYAVLDALGVRQAPPPPAVEALRPFVTQELGMALQRAARPATSPAVPDSGAWFGSLPEGFTSADPRAAVVRGDTTLVVMAMANTREKPAVSWTDTIVVVSEQGRLVVADLRYGAGWDFARRGTLRMLLDARGTEALPNP
ncbi:MAG: hypothetical protein RLZZ621_1963 [Gemmatimonadota bacterium]